MVLTCVVCKTNAKRNPNLSFHSFPKNEEKRKEWVQILGINLKWKSWHRLCSNHFRSKDLNTENNIRTLMPNVNPININNDDEYCPPTLISDFQPQASEITPIKNIVHNIFVEHDYAYISNGFGDELDLSTSCESDIQSLSTCEELISDKKTSFVHIADTSETCLSTPVVRKRQFKLFKSDVTSLKSRNKQYIWQNTHLEKNVPTLMKTDNKLTSSNPVPENIVVNCIEKQNQNYCLYVVKK